MKKPLATALTFAVTAVLVVAACLTLGCGSENQQDKRTSKEELQNINVLPSDELLLLDSNEETDSVAGHLAQEFSLENQNMDEYLEEMLRSYYPLPPAEPLLLDANKEKSFIVGLNETLILDSDEDFLGLADDYFYACFDWIGTMKVTLVDVAVYNSMKDAGINSSDPFYRTVAEENGGQAIKFVLCSFILENVDATPDTSFSRSGNFNIDTFRLVIEGSTSRYMPPNERLPSFYFDGTIPNAGPAQLNLYSLGKGEAKLYRLGFFVDEDDLYKPCAICIGISSKPPANLKYQLRFEITPDMVTRGADD